MFPYGAYFSGVFDASDTFRIVAYSIIFSVIEAYSRTWRHY